MYIIIRKIDNSIAQFRHLKAMEWFMSLTDSLTHFILIVFAILRFGRRICHAIIMIMVGITFLMFLLVYKGEILLRITCVLDRVVTQI